MVVLATQTPATRVLPGPHPKRTCVIHAPPVGWRRNNLDGGDRASRVEGVTGGVTPDAPPASALMRRLARRPKSPNPSSPLGLGKIGVNTTVSSGEAPASETVSVSPPLLASEAACIGMSTSPRSSGMILSPRSFSRGDTGEHFEHEPMEAWTAVNQFTYALEKARYD